MSEGDTPSAIDSLIEEILDARDEAENRPAEAEASEADVDAAEPDNTVPAVEPSEPVMKLGYADVAGQETDAAAPVAELDQVIAERDTYLADSQRLAADFANFRKQSEKRVSDAAAAQSAALVRNLLPVLDACDSALEQDPESGVAPIRAALLAELEKSGLALVSPEPDDHFDPELHDAVMHQPAEDGSSGIPVVGEVLRSGYSWQGRIVRPAMVRVVG
ncbi:MAG: nucleotide exchange factor GrpE [Acidimicrobiales bacterium]|nr:nucleotide exchange factor GrpE [Acidimicrobiales bacterium]RZV43908.1 MAG: nucleotide exchange factor GrpE [Acidimicrobiales bacterium]